MSSSPFADAAVSKPGKVALIVAAAVFQGVLLVGMIAVHAAPLMMGETIRLKAEPVDPRDLFRGDYVVLGYDFSNTPPDQIAGLPISGNRYDRSHDGREVYISLQPAADGEYHEASAVVRRTVECTGGRPQRQIRQGAKVGRQARRSLSSDPLGLACLLWAEL